MPKEIINAGTILFGVLETSLNTDEPGPVQASIIHGKYKGAKLIGTLVRQDQKVLLSFTTMVVPGVRRSIATNIVAIDPRTSRTAFSSYTDNHLLFRYGSLFASSFISGLGQITAASGTQIVKDAGTNETFIDSPGTSVTEKALIALGNVGTQWSSKANANFQTAPTVYVDAGTEMGLLFTSDLEFSYDKSEEAS